jgi:hypothetical protein
VKGVLCGIAILLVVVWLLDNVVFEVTDDVVNLLITIAIVAIIYNLVRSR